METYKLEIELTKKQALILIKALDLYARIGIGQIEEVARVYNEHSKVDSCDRELIDEKLRQFKLALTGFPMNASHGIFAPELHDNFKIAYDIEQVLRYKIAWTEQPEGGFGTWFDEPLRVGSEELPKVEVNK